MATWDPTQYEQFADQRTRPFFDLLARVPHDRPGLVIDLGCGNGIATLAAADRWPDATVVGIDNSGCHAACRRRPGQPAGGCGGSRPTSRPPTWARTARPM